MKDDVLAVLVMMLIWILLGGVPAFLELGIEPCIQGRRKWWWQK